MFIKFPSLSFSKNKQKSDFDSILPLTNKSSSAHSKYSVLGYLYDTSTRVGTVISGSCHYGFTYVSEVAETLLKFGLKNTNDSLPKTHQDAEEMHITKYFNPFGIEVSQTPVHAPIQATNETLKQNESIIKTPSFPKYY